ncbi:hypothetical protein H4N58_03570 [Mumia sp. ZJ1417]|uniref:HD domain-containing protein n=1 Tax=Mumia sp. ZJ1417 TaxID=2708082 RepID=UPI00142076A2|nr:hypothetical protein [Mumia sp. ZJ1417]QMW67027.1 hypothetical protein H4N58_03570 [Mumia sp. ZJ1417]
MHPRIRLELAKRWSEPHREHHDIDHLSEVIGALDTLTVEGLAFDVELARAAAWFHDAVYDVHRADSVERSALLAQRWLGPGYGDRVAEIVLATRDHLAAPDDIEAAAVCDADLSILGQDEARYDRYAAAIRTENDYLPAADYRQLRAMVMSRYQNRPRIFVTEPGYRLWESSARANITRELTALGRPVPV